MSEIEGKVVLLLDQDKSVVDFVEQPISIPQKQSVPWIPDFAVLYKSGKIVIYEVKRLDEILDPEKNDEFKKKYQEAERWCNDQGYEFVVITDQILNNNDRVNNCRLLRKGIKKIEAKEYIQLSKHIKAKVKTNPGIPITELVKHLRDWDNKFNYEQNQILPTIYSMIYYGELVTEPNFEKRITTSTMLFTLDKNEKTDLESLYYWFSKTNYLDQKLDVTETIPIKDLHSIPKKHFDIAKRRLSIIQPILDGGVTSKAVQKAAVKNKVYHTTIWKWIKLYRKNYDFFDLVPKYNKRGRKAVSRDHVIWAEAISHYLSEEEPSYNDSYLVMQATAMKYGLLDYCPSYHTFYREILKMNREEVLLNRKGRNTSDKEFIQAISQFPNQDFALQVGQIDHTRIDVVCVDNETRLPVGNPWVTILFDIHSRVVLGYALTFNKPSRLSNSICLISAVNQKYNVIKKIKKIFPNLNKKEGLENIFEEIENSEWGDVFGLPFLLHMDNGPDFRSNDMKLFGAVHNIDLQYRPVKKSQFGAHVERYLGTLNNRLHNISGSTSSNIEDKGDYDSEKKAIMTIDELEAYILVEIIKYHDEYHAGILTTPIAKWKKSFRLDHLYTTPHRNLPKNYDRFRLDVLPSERRVVQLKGRVEIFNGFYNAPEIKKWIGAKDPKNIKLSRKFIIRFDPRDIRTIYFYDPELEEYIILKSTNPLILTEFNQKPLPLWLYETAKKKVSIKGKKQVNQNKVLLMVLAQLAMIDESKKKKKKIRLQSSILDRDSKQKNQDYNDENDFQNIQEDNIDTVTPSDEQNKQSKLSYNFEDNKSSYVRIQPYKKKKKPYRKMDEEEKE